MSTRQRPAPSSWIVWWAAFGSILLWMVHLVSEAALVAVRGQHPDVMWVMHGLTMVLAGAVLIGMWYCWSLTKLSTDSESVGSPGGRTVFIGWLGVLIGALNLLLIVYEGVLVGVWNHGIRN
jgi:hypothetical protein